MDPIRIFVGADRSQALAIRVLEHSIRRHTRGPVELTPMIDLDVPVPKDPKQRQRTEFSFSRFCIPKLAGYQGRAIYMDADMLVLCDIRELWELPMYSHKVLVQEELEEDEAIRKGGRRIKQCAVMLLDCQRLDWDIKKIVQGLDAKDYTYEDLVYHLCLLGPDEVGYKIPFEWNSLEKLTHKTCNIHYTDMPTQPWVSPANPNDDIWLREVRLMLEDGSLTRAELLKEIELGYFRPSLWTDLQLRPRLPKLFVPFWRRALLFSDRFYSGYVAHRALSRRLATEV